MDTLLTSVQVAAKAITATGPYTSGALSRSIFKDGPNVAGNIVSGSVGSDLSYADIVHDGASIHHIFPKAAPGVWRFGSRRKPQLKFYWRKVGKSVYFPHIPASVNTMGLSHPGYRGKKYLSDPLKVFGRAQGFRVTTVQL